MAASSRKKLEKSKSKTCCGVYGCTNSGIRNNSVKYHRLPSASVRSDATGIETLLAHRRRALWLKNLRLDLTETKIKNLRVCSRHFAGGEACRGLYPLNHPGWAPTLHLGHNKKVSANLPAHETIADSPRGDRLRDRSQRKEVASALLLLNGSKNSQEQHESVADIVETSDSQLTDKDNNTFHEDLIIKNEDSNTSNCVPILNPEVGSSAVTVQVLFTGSRETELLERLEEANKKIEQLQNQLKNTQDELKSSKEAFAASVEQISHFEKHMHELEAAKRRLAMDVDYFSSCDNGLLFYYTGFPDFETLQSTFTSLEPSIIHNANRFKLSKSQEFILTLIRLHQNADLRDLAVRYNISEPTASRIVFKWKELLQSRPLPSTVGTKRKVSQKNASKKQKITVEQEDLHNEDIQVNFSCE